MWSDFVLAVLVGVALLYLPGFLLVRLVASSNVTSFVYAPVVSLTMYCAMGAFNYSLGIHSSVVSIGVLALGVVVGAYAVALGIRRSVKSLWRPACDGDLGSMARCSLYIGVGVVAASLLFVLPLDGPASLVQTYDNVHHFGLVRSFVDSGDWSLLHTSLYLDEAGRAVNPLPGAGYYPAAWHVLCAMVVGASSVDLPVVVNSVNFILVAIAFPSAVFMLVKTLFPDNARVVVLGAVCVAAFGAFPWVLVDVWPLYPNTLSLTMMPSVIACFIRVCSDNVTCRRRVLYGSGFVVGLLCLTFSQPNSIFSMAVFLIPFCIYRASCIAYQRCPRDGKKAVRAFVVGAATLLAICVIWLLLTAAPFLQAVVGYYWPPITSGVQGAFDVLKLLFAGSVSQPVLAVFVFLGIAYACIQRRYLWIACSYALSCLIYYVASTFGDTWIKHVMSGFWYTDPYRIGAFASIFAIPLAAMGLYFAMKVVERILESAYQRKGSFWKLVPAIAVVVPFAVFVYAPNAVTAGRWDAFRGFIETAASLNDNAATGLYDSREKAFVEEVKQVVSDDELIVNHPYDGSLFAYSVSDLNIYYRYIAGYGFPGETPKSVSIREGLAGWPNCQKTKEALRSVDARYVLLLDIDRKRAKDVALSYDEGAWIGLETITDETAGFEVVLRDGDMRLYRILDEMA